MKRFLIVCNPIAGKGLSKKHLSIVKKQLEKHSIDYVEIITKYRFDAQNNIKKWINNITDIIVIGGDGTLNEIINGLYPNILPLRIISAGTGNDFIKSIKTISFEQLFVKDDFQSIDLFSINNLIGVNALGIGFDGEVVNDMNKSKLPFRGLLAYFIFVIKNLFLFNPPFCNVKVDNKEYRGKFFINTIANGKSVGGGFYLTPFAKTDDAFLDICLISNVSALFRLYYLFKVMRVQHINDKKTLLLKAKSIIIEYENKIKAQLDGQLIEDKIFDIKIIPLKLKIMASVL